MSAFKTQTQLTFQITTDYSRLHLDKLLKLRGYSFILLMVLLLSRLQSNCNITILQLPLRGF